MPDVGKLRTKREQAGPTGNLLPVIGTVCEDILIPDPADVLVSDSCDLTWMPLGPMRGVGPCGLHLIGDLDFL